MVCAGKKASCASTICAAAGCLDGLARDMLGMQKEKASRAPSIFATAIAGHQAVRRKFFQPLQVIKHYVTSDLSSCIGRSPDITPQATSAAAVAGRQTIRHK